MKNIKLLLCALFLLLFTIANAQIDEKESTMSLGNQNAIVVEILNTDSKTAENVWKKFVEEYGKVKKNKKAKEFYMEETNIPAISGNSTCDIYTKFEERAGLVNAYFWIDMGSSFLSSENNQDGFQGAKTFFTEYGYSVEKHLIGEELEDEMKALKNFQKDLGKLIKENKNYHKEIEEAREKIRKAEINIEKNVVAQENKNAEIDGQSSKVKAIEDRLNMVGKKPAAQKIELPVDEGKTDDGGSGNGGR